MPLKPSVVCPSAMAPLFSTRCPNHFLFTQPTENAPVLITVSEPSHTFQPSLRREGKAKRPAFGWEKLLPLQGCYHPALRVFLLRSLPPPLWPLPPSAPKLRGAASHEALPASLLGPPCLACLPGGGLVSAPAQPPLSWPQVSCPSFLSQEQTCKLTSNATRATR